MHTLGPRMDLKKVNDKAKVSYKIIENDFLVINQEFSTRLIA